MLRLGTQHTHTHTHLKRTQRFSCFDLVESEPFKVSRNKTTSMVVQDGSTGFGGNIRHLMFTFYMKNKGNDINHFLFVVVVIPFLPSITF